MASTIMATITRLDLDDLSTPSVAVISDVKHLSSYNWIEAPTPTIAVPGSPPLWSTPAVPRQLKKDSGLIYVNQNAARHPDSPLEPLFRALYITNPSFDLSPIDVVTDRNNIRKLLSFVNPGSNSYELESFTINIEVIKNTAIFCREETETRLFIGPHEFRGFGHEFTKAYTTSQVRGSSGHHRIIAYRFGDLNFIVRHESDGYVTNAETHSSASKEPDTDSLSGKLVALSLSPTANIPNTTSASSKLATRKDGQTVPLESTLEIKTRVFHKRLEIQDIAPQLWVSQTPKLVRAYHRHGMFRKPEVEDIAAEIKRWEIVNQRDLRKLAALIHKVVGVAKGCSGNVLVKYDIKGDKLVVYKAVRRMMLPEDLYSKWDDTSVGMVPQLEETSTIVPKSIEPFDDASSNAIPSPGALAGSEGGPDQNTTESRMEHANVPFFDIITFGIQNGFRHFFRRMPCELADYRILCRSLDSLAIDVVKQRNLQEIVKELKTGDNDYDPQERRTIVGWKGRARNAAFTLLYLFLVGESEWHARDRTVAYNAVQYVVSHGRKFKYRTRKMVREAFEERFIITPKQRLGLDKWPITEPQEEGWQDAEGTTEEETPGFDFDWDSDWS